MDARRLSLPVNREGILSFVQEFAVAGGIGWGATMAADRILHPSLVHSGNIVRDFIGGPGGGYLIAFAGASLIPILANCVDMTTRKNADHDYFCAHTNENGKIAGAIAGIVLTVGFLSSSLGVPFTKSGAPVAELAQAMSGPVSVTGDKLVTFLTQPTGEARSSPYVASYGPYVAYIPPITPKAPENPSL